jgi:hypothetical protein
MSPTLAVDEFQREYNHGDHGDTEMTNREEVRSRGLCDLCGSRRSIQ